MMHSYITEIEDRGSDLPGQLLHVPPISDMVKDAYDRLSSLRMKDPSSVFYTPVIRSSWLSSQCDSVYVKLESEQITNSFKVRGALNYVSASLNSGGREIVTASTGNHAMAVAHALKIYGIPGTIFVPENIKESKHKSLTSMVQGTRVQLRRDGKECLEAEQKARKFGQMSSAMYISPYNDKHVVAGQGTVALEILELLNRCGDESVHKTGMKCCYVTVGGGGLISGIASCLKSKEPGKWRIVGCLPANSPAMYESVKAGKVVSGVCTDTLSDGSAGDIEDNSFTLDLCSKLVDAWAIITESDIESSIREMFVHDRKVVEGAAATALAGCRIDAEWRVKNNCSLSFVIACGSNIDPSLFAEILFSKNVRNDSSSSDC